MTVINDDMTSSQTTVPVADPAALAPGFYTIDDENIEVLGPERRAEVGDRWSRIGARHQKDVTAPTAALCTRAVGGSTAASHSDGATLTRYYPDAPPAASEGGGSSPLRSYTITVADVLAAPGTNAATGVADSDNDAQMSYIAVESGISGNLIAVISDVQPSVGALTVDVDGTTITLHLETDGDSVVLSTYTEVQTALSLSPAAMALVTATFEGVNVATEPYAAGDVYLGDGVSRLVLDTFAEGDVVVWAWVFVPETWDATTALVPGVGVGRASLFYDGPPDLTTVDDTNADGVGVSQSTPPFDPLHPIRLTADGDLGVTASCEAGTVPSQGEMLLMVDVRTPVAA